MNFLNKGFLKLALLPKGAYTRLGVNYAHLQAILLAKLTMDDRRPNTMMQMRQQKSDKPVTGATIMSMFISAVMGLLYLISFALGNDIIVQLTFYFSLFFFMLSAMLIADFTGVLIDVRDNYIILPKPVSDRTVVVARLLHIFIHICKLVIPMSFSGLVYIIYNYGAWPGVVFLLLVMLNTLFAIFFINAVYILILKITSPEKFKTIINYVQVVFAVAMFASYQILPRMMDKLETFDLALSDKYSSLALPFFWFAAGWKAFSTIDATTVEWMGAICSLVLPPLCLWIVVKFLAPSFNRKLSGINSVAAEKEKEVSVMKKSTSYAHSLSQLLTQRGAERIGFLFTWKMTGRSKDFQLRFYPTIGYILVFIVIMLMGKKRGGFDLQSADAARNILLSCIYISAFLLITAIQQMNNSEKWKASWMYLIAPVQTPGAIILGGVKAVMAKFYLPIAVVIVATGLALSGWKAIPNLLLGIVNILLIIALVANIAKRGLPFSVQETNNDKGGNFLKAMVMMISVGVVSVLHFFIFNMLPVVIIFVLLSSIATWLLLDNLKRTSWHQIQQA